MKKLLSPVYAELDEKDDWILGFTPEDIDLIREGYACPHCMEVFQSGGLPMALFKCPVCRRDTALADPVRAFTETPQHWLDYVKKREKVLSEPPRRR